MTKHALVVILLAAATLGAAAPASAADTPIEIGTSMAGLSVGFGDNDVRTFGVPSASFGILNPSVYASIFTAPRISVEPQLGLVVVSTGRTTAHVVNLAGQLNYFTRGHDGASPYVFGSLGVIDVSSSPSSPVVVSGGVGYRAPVGGRLVFRGDVRLQHYSDNGGTALLFTWSIGGLFDR